ncbi:hypothetical protein [Streptomyces sp. NPDC091027]|uniref:hypothetical protein n=1 Tax=Streptomyces sp. NPDC091027 TaxID=3365971 RepID=UPI003819EFD4
MATLLISSQPAQAAAATLGSDPLLQYPLDISGSATSASSGTAAITTLRPAGGFADLGVVGIASADPAMSFIRGMEIPGPLTSTWQRMSLTATAPIDYERGEAGRLWNGASYASVGLRWDGMPASSTVAFDRVQFARATSGNLLGRSAAFHDDHMCYESGSGTITARTRERSMVGTHSAKCTIAFIPGGSDGWELAPHTDALAPLKAGGGRVIGRVSVSTDVSRRWRVRVRAYDANYALVYDGLSSAPNQTSQPNGVWSTAQFSATMPSTARYAAVTPYVYHDSASPQVGWHFYSDAHFISYDTYQADFRIPDWQAPRSLNIRVKPRRVNLINNPGFHAGAAGWGYFGASGVSGQLVWDSATGRVRSGSVKFHLPNGNTPAQTQLGMSTLGGINPGAKGGDMLRTGVPHTISAWVKVPAGYPPVSAAAWDPLAAVFRYGPDTDWIRANRPELVQGEWVRVYYTWTPPETSTRQFYGGVMVPQTAYTGSSNGLSFWVDDVLLEETDELRDYFDGADISADYLWQGNSNMSKSLHFPGRARHAQRLTEILQDNVPWGTTFNLVFS